MEEIGEIETVPEPAVNGEDKNGGKLEQEGEEEERVEDLIEEVEPEEIERDSNSNDAGGAATATRDAGDSDQELDELLDGIISHCGMAAC